VQINAIDFIIISNGGAEVDSIDRLNQAIRYIEENLIVGVDYDEISKITLSPISAFQRFFLLTAGIPLSEYIRRRKLSCAMNDLKNTNDRIIDIALKYGYDSPDAFSVAFKRTYNVTPSTARQENIKLVPFHRIYFDLSVKSVIGDVKVKKITGLVANVNEVEIFEMPNMMLVGREIRTLGDVIILGSNGEHVQLPPGVKGNRAPELWQACIEDGSLDVIRSLPSIIPDALIGWTGNYGYGDDTSASYIVGAFVPFGTPIPLGYACRVLPATLIAKGIYGTGYPSVIEVYESWGYIRHNSELCNWWGEIYFKDDPVPTMWSPIVPIRKV
jgi:AraC-like DNA-binding protein